MKRAAFTLLELLLILGLVVVLLTIVIPYAAAFRESAQRIECANNLRAIRNGLNLYADANEGVYPRVMYAGDVPGYTAFTGADDSDPFTIGAGDSVQPNDVTASLWLLMREAYLRDAAFFVCPSTWDKPDPLTDAHGDPVGASQRGNFRGPDNLSYSYADPFSSAERFGLKRDNLLSDFALLADKNRGANIAGRFPVARDAEAANFFIANSPNHNGGGQNILFADTNVEWFETPYPDRTPDGTPDGNGAPDNIYSTLSIDGLPAEHDLDKDAPGYVGRNLAPSYWLDSYLVPTALDE